jgi:membrane-associated phospholipid phosphatase
VIVVGLWFFAGIIQDLVGKDPLVLLDVRLHNSVPLFRSTAMTWFMLALTEIGSPAVLWVVCIGGALIALSRGNRRLAATLVLAIAGTGLLSLILKTTIGFARPTDALIAAHEASFPSGHLLSGAVVYGLLASLLLRSHMRRMTRAIGTALLLLLVVGIGLSRLYLGVHWPSDLLGSLALALICLAILLFFLHYERELPRIDSVTVPPTPSVLRIGGIAVLVASVATGALLVRHTKIVAVGPPPPSRQVVMSTLLAGLPTEIPRRSEGLIGEPMEPISIVVIGSKEQVIAAFQHGGWTLADLPTPIRVMQEGLAVLANRPDASGPATPAYLADRPQTLTFEKPDATAPGIRRRHHTRVWQTPYCANLGCQPIWVATGSFDIGVELSATLHLPTHRIDPNIDAERALIVTDLTAAGAKELGTMTVVAPLRGTNAGGDPFMTDGRAAILALPPI